MRATLGLSAWALSFFRLIDCLRGSSPSYDLWERRWQGRASSLAISAGMGKNISLTGLSLLPGDSSSCSSCQLARKLQAMWPLCIFPPHWRMSAPQPPRQREPVQCRPAAADCRRPGGRLWAVVWGCAACSVPACKGGTTTTACCGPSGWLTSAELISGCSKSRLIRTLMCTFRVYFQISKTIEAGFAMVSSTRHLCWELWVLVLGLFLPSINL